jgi:two-component system sensor histidine kinase HupT/HoxJ
VTWLVRSASIKPEVLHEGLEQLVIDNYEGYVSQILVNLVQNALDAMEHQAQPCLSTTIQLKDNQVLIQIRNNGTGINELDLHKLFDPFFTTKPIGKGTGLGLYISYGLATEQCRGGLSARNYYEKGKNGALFELSLPLKWSETHG